MKFNIIHLYIMFCHIYENVWNIDYICLKKYPIFFLYFFMVKNLFGNLGFLWAFSHIFFGVAAISLLFPHQSKIYTSVVKLPMFTVDIAYFTHFIEMVMTISFEIANTFSSGLIIGLFLGLGIAKHLIMNGFNQGIPVIVFPRGFVKKYTFSSYFSRVAVPFCLLSMSN